MEQEIPVVIHQSSETDQKTPSPVSGQIREIGTTLFKTLCSFRESEQYEQLKQGTDKVKAYMQEHPISSILYTFGVGTLLGFLLKRRH